MLGRKEPKVVWATEAREARRWKQPKVMIGVGLEKEWGVGKSRSGWVLRRSWNSHNPKRDEDGLL